MKTQKEVEEMISGKEAIEAFLNGDDVEFMDKTGQWRTMLENTILRVFLDHDKFRLKPQTITIESFGFKGSVSMEKYSDSINIVFSNKDDCARWHEALRQVFK